MAEPTTANSSSYQPRGRTDSQIAQVHRAFREIRADYAAAQPSRFRRSRRNLGGNADAHYQSETKFLEMREYVRDMDRNDGVIGQAVDRAVSNMMQGGFNLEPQTGDSKLDLDLWQRWTDWAEDPEQCDLAGEYAWPDMEAHNLRAQLIDGDMFDVLTSEGSVEMVEAHRCRTPANTSRNVVHGVLLDDRRRRQQFWFTKTDIDPMVRLARVADIVPYDVRDEEGNRAICQVYNATRISQSRGISAFHAVFDVCGMFEDVNFAKLVQAQMVSCIGYAIESSSNVQMGPQTQTPLPNGTTSTEEGLSAGFALRLKPGEKLQTFSPNVPNAEYFDHVKLLLQIVGLNIGMPLVLFLMDASETNFSGWRAAVDQARLGFRTNQLQLMRRLHRPAYRWKVRDFLAEDAALRSAAGRSNISIFKHKWLAPKWPYIQPEIEASGDATRLKNLLVSPRSLHSERGGDWDDVYRETVEDNSAAIAAAITASQKIKKETEVDVDWREILFLTEGELITTRSEDRKAGSQASRRGGQQPAPAPEPAPQPRKKTRTS